MNEVKEQAIKFIQMAPDENMLSLEDVMKELYFKMQVDKGLSEIDQGLGVSHEDAKKRMAKWLQE